MNSSWEIHYDDFPYTSNAFAFTHPQHLAMIARLRGMVPARAERCRVLEIGTRQGGNLVPLAYALPGSAFVGLDRAAKQMPLAQARAAELGLTNVTWQCVDLLDAPADLGTFDYIVAHGFYSWVPEPVRRRLWDVCRRHLAPQGVAYVSFNIYPGYHLREYVRQAARFGLRGLTSVEEFPAQARSVLRQLVSGAAEGRTAGQQVLREQGGLLLRHPEDRYLLHDLLEPLNEPQTFQQVVGEAGTGGLQYLADAFLSDWPELRGLPEHAAGWLGTNTRAELEAACDVWHWRPIRAAAWCRDDCTLAEKPVLAAVDELLALAEGRLTGRIFETADGLKLACPEAWQAALLKRLAGAAPRAVPVRELRDLVPGPQSREQPTRLAEWLLAAAAQGGLELLSWQPDLAGQAGPRPRASAVARAQAGRGREVTNLRHLMLQFEDDFAPRLLSLLDGQRDRAALARELSRGHLVPETGELAARAAAGLTERIERTLATFAQRALLHAD